VFFFAALCCWFFCGGVGGVLMEVYVMYAAMIMPIIKKPISCLRSIMEK